MNTIQTYDINRVFRIIRNYAWIGSGALFVSYLYFVGSITFSIVKQQDIQSEIKTLVSSMGKQELIYLQTQKKLTEEYAYSLGMTAADVVTFSAPKRAFAWNVGH